MEDKKIVTNVTETTENPEIILSNVVSGSTPFKSFATQEEFDNYNAYIRKSIEEKALKKIKVDDGENGQVDLAKVKIEWRKTELKELEAIAEQNYEKRKNQTAEEAFQEMKKTFEVEMNLKNREYNLRIALDELKKVGIEIKDDDIDTTPYLKGVTADQNSIGSVLIIAKDFKKSNDEMRNKIMSELGGSRGDITINGNTSNLQTEYDEAKKNGNSVLMSFLLRKAQENGIQLK